MAPEVACRIVVLGAPPGVDDGLQKGHGSKYETVQTERSNGEDLPFAFRMGVKAGGKGAPDSGGPLVEGPRAGVSSTSTVLRAIGKTIKAVS